MIKNAAGSFVQFAETRPVEFLRPVRSPQQDQERFHPTSLKTYIPTPVKRALRPVLLSPAFNTIANAFKGRVTCLTYHSVTTQRYCSSVFDPNIGLKVHVDCFEEQLKYLSKNANVSSIDDAVASLNSNDTRHRVVLTFDDGYVDFKTLVLPLIEKYNVPVTLFVTTDFLSRKQTFWWEELELHIRHLNSLTVTNLATGELFQETELANHTRKKNVFARLRSWILNGTETLKADLLSQLRAQSEHSFDFNGVLTWADVKELSSHPLVTIGSHSVTHPNFKLLNDKEKDFQLSESKLILEQHLGTEITSFAFPVGSRDQAGDADFAKALQHGYKCAVTSRVAHWHPAHGKKGVTALPRIHIDYSDGSERFACKLSGREAFMWSPLQRVVTL